MRPGFPPLSKAKQNVALQEIMLVTDLSYAMLRLSKGAGAIRDVEL